jgi:WD40 repeat protein
MLAGGGTAPAALTATTIRAAVPFALHRSLQGAVSAGALILAEGGLKSIFAGKSFILAVALAAALALAGYQLSAIGDGPQPAGALGLPNADARTASVDAYGDPLPPGAVARLGTIRYRFGGTGSVFLPDGKTVVSVGQGNAIKIWDARTGRLVREIDTGYFAAGHRSGIALSADGKRLAAGGSLHDAGKPGWRSAVRVFDLATGKDIRTFERSPREGVNALAITPDGKLVFILDGNGKLRIEEVDTGAVLLTQQFPRDVSAALAMSPDGATVAVATGPNSRKTLIWRWQAADEPREVKAPGSDRSADVAFSPDGKCVASCDGTRPDVCVWDVADGRLLRRLELPDYERMSHRRVAFSPDGKLIAASGDGGTNWRGLVHLWDPTTGKFVRQLERGLGPNTHGEVLAFSPDGKLLVAGSHVWDLAADKELSANGAAHFGPLWGMVSGDKDLVVTAGDDHTARVWDAATGKHVHRLIHDGTVGGVALSHDGRLLVSVSSDDVLLWDVGTGKRIYRLPGHGRLGTVLRPAIFAPDDKSFLSFGPDMGLRKWDVRTGKAIAEHFIRPTGIRIPNEDDESIARDEIMLILGGANFTPDSKHLVLPVGSQCFVFDTATGNELRSFPGEGNLLIGMTISPDGKEVLASAYGKLVETRLPDGTTQVSPPKGHRLTLWDLATGTPRQQIELPEERPGPVAFSPDGAKFAAASSGPGACIRLMDATTGRELRKIEGLRSIVHSLAFMPDGKRLVSGMEDSSALIWDLTR